VNPAPAKGGPKKKGKNKIELFTFQGPTTPKPSWRVTTFPKASKKHYFKWIVCGVKNT